MAFLTKATVKEHCRTCLKELIDTTEGGTNVENLDEMMESKNLHFNICNDPELQQLISINVDGPCMNDTMNLVIHNFPENVCLTCYNKLHNFATFRRRAQQSAEKLRTVLNCSGNIKVEINFYEELEFQKIGTQKDDDVQPPAAEQCEFQLHDATAENEETFFETTVADLANVEMNDVTVDPFSPSAPSVSESCDKDYESELEDKKLKTKPVVKKEVLSKIKKDRKQTAAQVAKKNKYRCPQCDQGFVKNYQLTAHVDQEHAAGSRPFFCDYCDRSYRSLRNLKGHIVQLHQDKIKEQEHFQCPECPKAFLDNTALKIHIGLHRTDKKTQVCGFCAERFPVKKWLVEHLRSHTPDGRIPCDLCDKTYSRIEDLENHKRSTHLKEKPHYCPVCDKSFQNKQSFRIHSYRHSGKKPYLCDICGKDFRQATAMKTHRLTHLKNEATN